MRVLEIDAQDTKEVVKKNYRKKIRTIHPDVNPEAYDIDLVHRINDAYRMLMHYDGPFQSIKLSAETLDDTALWNVKTNEYAYSERDIFQSVEDYDGNEIGSFHVASGKYLWDLELEEFPLFMKSIYACCEALIGERNCEIDKKAQLAYLLASQFVDYTYMDAIIPDKQINSNGDEIYHLKAMVELENIAFLTGKSGDLLYPYCLRDRKLYIKNSEGNKIGYLSFEDNRLYYYLIPLFEHRLVQVKIQVSEIQKSKNRKKDSVLNVDLWVKRKQIETQALQESINVKIDRLLNTLI